MECFLEELLYSKLSCSTIIIGEGGCMMIYMTIKRCIDIICSLIALVIFSPIFLIIAVFIKGSSNGPVFFRQKRIGKNKSEFTILKFRTMRMETPKDMPTHLLHNADVYITNIGKILRKTSLDELPQIINILRGEMSIIGPRPALWNQFELIVLREQYKVNTILPGLTGWAQVNGRDELSINAKVKFDYEYIQKVNLFFDLKIFFISIHNVIYRTGVLEGNSKIE